MSNVITVWADVSLREEFVCIGSPPPRALQSGHPPRNEAENPFVPARKAALLETGPPKFLSPHEHQSRSRHPHLNHTTGLPPPAAHHTSLAEVVASEIHRRNYPLSLAGFYQNELV